jgi:hypothetical protein
MSIRGISTLFAAREELYAVDYSKERLFRTDENRKPSKTESTGHSSQTRRPASSRMCPRLYLPLLTRLTSNFVRLSRRLASQPSHAYSRLQVNAKLPRHDLVQSRFSDTRGALWNSRCLSVFFAFGGVLSDDLTIPPASAAVLAKTIGVLLAC